MGMDQKKNRNLVALGGKITQEDQQTSVETAAREVWEETGAITNKEAMVKALKSRDSQVYWYSPGKFAMYLLDMRTIGEKHKKDLDEGGWNHDLPQRFRQELVNPQDLLVNLGSREMTSLHWVPIVEFTRGLGVPHINADGQTLPFSDTFSRGLLLSPLLQSWLRPKMTS
eukprot:TRINITY_DN1156_c0_g1_i1.p1 TRINITY_DN1156_c0_g1~~TRINITY_DN1156_c0_g1_i1.p1  ORF type:complete len:170 (-),score=36.77 TRINITY_DN1156_c0_g1_i1:505-1014(-)